MPIDCPKCGGSGGGPDPATSCSKCDGTGWLDTDEDRALDALIVMAFLDPDAPDLMADLDLAEPPELSEEDRVAFEKIDINAIIARAKEDTR